MRIRERSNSGDTKVSEDGGEGGVPGVSTEIPVQPEVKSVMRQAVPLQPMEADSGTEVLL